MKNNTLFTTLKPLILASSSPRRQMMLKNLGIDFDTAPAHIDETPLFDESPEGFASRMAKAKTFKVAKDNPRAWIIGADTVVCIGEKILGKPEGKKDALAILKQLVNKQHQVLTGLCLCHTEQLFEKIEVERSLVTFIDAGDDILRAYVQTGEPLDKAGAYGIQGIGSFLIRAIEGSCTNVIGLPMEVIIPQLLAQQIIAPN